GNIVAIVDSAQKTIVRNGEKVTPSGSYEYDAIYRLIHAEGREHAGQNSDIQQDAFGFPIVGAPHPNDPQAMRNYSENYAYDEVGNILSMRHQTAMNGPGTWTRKYEIDGASNRLKSTSLPGDAQAPYSEKYTYDPHGNMTAMPHLPRIDWDPDDQMAVVD